MRSMSKRALLGERASPLSRRSSEERRRPGAATKDEDRTIGSWAATRRATPPPTARATRGRAEPLSSCRSAWDRRGRAARFVSRSGLRGRQQLASVQLAALVVVALRPPSDGPPRPGSRTLRSSPARGKMRTSTFSQRDRRGVAMDENFHVVGRYRSSYPLRTRLCLAWLWASCPEAEGGTLRTN